MNYGLNGNNQCVSLITAQDTRANGPMQSIKYHYHPNGRFRGQVRSEQYYWPKGAAPTATPKVSTLTSNAFPTATAAVQTETRGDAAVSRTIRMEKLNGGAGPPFVTYKTDYNGVQEKYFYNANFFLNKITDRRNNSTNFNVESVIGNITRKTHPTELSLTTPTPTRLI